MVACTFTHEDITCGPVHDASDAEEYALMSNLAILHTKTFKTKKPDETTQVSSADSTYKSPRVIAKMTIPISSAGRFQTSDPDDRFALAQLARDIPSFKPSSTFYSPAGTSEQYSITGLMLVCYKAQINSATDVEIRLVLVRNATKVPCSIDSVRSKLVIFVNAGSDESLQTALSTLQTYIKVPVQTVRDTATTHKIFVNIFDNSPPTTHVTSAPYVLSETNTLYLTQLMFFCNGYGVVSEQHAPSRWTDTPELTFPLKSVSAATVSASNKRKRDVDTEASEEAETSE